MNPEDYQRKLEKVKEAAAKKEKRLLKRIELAKNKPKPLMMKKLKKDLKSITHAIVRLTYEVCYSCDKFVPLNKRQAGHYHTDGGNPGVRYDFDNLRTQHGTCNYTLGGDPHYGANLLREIGRGRVDRLDRIRKIPPGWTKEQYFNLIEERKKLFIQFQSLSPAERKIQLNEYSLTFQHETN